MKSRLHILGLCMFLMLVNSHAIFSQDSENELQGENAIELQNLNDSINAVIEEQIDSAFAVRNQAIDSMIRQRNQILENHLYLADTTKKRVREAVRNMMQKMEGKQNQLKQKFQTQLQARKQQMDSLLAQKDSVFTYQIRVLDSIERRYYQMKEKGNDSAAFLQIQVALMNQQLDSIIRNSLTHKKESKKMLDSCANEEMAQLQQQLQRKQEKIDSIVGIRTQARLRITARNRTASGDSAAAKLSRLVDEMVFMDSNRVSIKFKHKLNFSHEIKNAFSLKADKQKKSTLEESIDIKEAQWDDSKSDVLNLVTAEAVENPESIELEFDGDVEVNEDEEITIISTTTDLIEREKNSVGVYPNPAANYIKLKDIEEGSLVEIYNMSGALVKSLVYNSGETIAISELPSNMYFVKVKESRGTVSFARFLKR